MRQLVVVLLQYLHGRWQDRGEVVVPCLDTLAVDIGLPVDGLSHRLVVEVLTVNIGKASIGAEDEKVTDTAFLHPQLTLADSDKFFFGQWTTFLALATLELAEWVLIGIILYVVVLSGQSGIMLQYLMIIMDGGLCTAGVLFMKEIIKSPDVLWRKVSEAVEFTKSLQGTHHYIPALDCIMLNLLLGKLQCDEINESRLGSLFLLDFTMFPSLRSVNTDAKVDVFDG